MIREPAPTARAPFFVRVSPVRWFPGRAVRGYGWLDVADAGEVGLGLRAGEIDAPGVVGVAGAVDVGDRLVRGWAGDGLDDRVGLGDHVGLGVGRLGRGAGPGGPGVVAGLSAG